MKVVINGCYGGFSVSEAGTMRYAELRGLTLYPERGKFSELTGPTYFLVPPNQRGPFLEGEAWYAAPIEARRASNALYDRQVFSSRDIPRSDAALVQVVEELGEAANGPCANLRVVEIPDGVDWEIQEYDGYEHVAEKHRTWP